MSAMVNSEVSRRHRRKSHNGIGCFRVKADIRWLAKLQARSRMNPSGTLTSALRQRVVSDTMTVRYRGSTMRLRASIEIALFGFWHLAFANAPAVLAQSGSVGGTIGDTDKSVSGSRPSATPSLLIGRWQWHAQCDGTNWEAAFVATAADGETVALEFIGAGGGTGIGSVTGNRVRLLRAFGNTTQVWTATLSDSYRMIGTISSSEGGRCSFRAAR